MNLEFRISRRDFLKASAGAVATVALSPASAFAQNESPSAEAKDVALRDFIQLGPTEHDLSLKDHGLLWVPDGHTPYVTLKDDTRRYFITARTSTHILATNGESLKDAVQNGHVNEDNLREVYTPDVNVAYKNGYTGITSVNQPNPKDRNHLIGVTHNEQHRAQGDGTGFTASISIVESRDGGLTWTDTGKLLQGLDTKEPGGEPVSGVGQPASMISGDHLYIWHIDWSANKQHPDQIYLARIGVNQDGQLGEFERLTHDGFKKDATIEELRSVIPVPDSERAVYSALPSISWNVHLNKFLAVFETAEGFYQTKSDNTIDWDQPVLFARFPTHYHERETMDQWFSYPTLISDQDSFESDKLTGKNGTLYFSKGYWKAGSHNMAARDFEII